MTPVPSILSDDAGFSLAHTCGPAAWAKGRWPNTDWLDDALVWVGWEDGRLATRTVREIEPGAIRIEGERDPGGDLAWARRVLGYGRVPIPVGDSIVAPIAARHSGLRPFASGSLFEGLVGSIVGQSITVMAAAVTEARLAALFHEGIDWHGRRFFPTPTAAQLAGADVAALRSTGMTWKRAEAISAIATSFLAGDLPDERAAAERPADTRAHLLGLAGVGPWTAESALLWGLGADDAFPPNDAALLRAARLFYGQPEMDHRGLIRLSAGWAPGRSWACRWLWTELLGPAGAQANQKSG